MVDLDIDPQAIPPRWPPMPESLIVNDGVYELRRVPLTSIVLVTNKAIKVKIFLFSCVHEY